MKRTTKQCGWWGAFVLALATFILPICAGAQDDYQQQDDPPSRVARLGYMEGSVSFDPAGEPDWVGAVENRPMTTGDKLWADKESKAELQLGSAVIRLSENTGVSILNLDDHTAQIQLSSGTINIRLRNLDRDDVFEIDTPNLAFTLDQPGSYRLEASEDGTYSVVTIREGEGEATGNGQTYRIHNGQRATFNGSDSLNADVEQVGEPDQFDQWAYNRENRHEHSRSAQYVSNDMVGYDDLDDNGDWRDDSNYGHVWYPHVEAGWAPYREGHWDWIDPWGYTWVDDSSWGYAPFHYGRWVSVGGRWGWIAGPREVHAVYAPALVVFVGGGGGFGGNVGWFPLGPREVYAPSYHVSREYMNRVNISNTTVNNTQITNVYNTTVINRSTTNITNVTYVNRNVQGAVTAVPQRAFASAQPVARSAVQVNQRELASAPVMHRVAVNPTREAVLGARAGTANHVTAPPAAVANRQVIAKKTPPPPPPSFAKQQQAMAAHPGQPLPKREMASLRPAEPVHPAVKVAPPGKPAQPTTGHPNAPAANAGRPGQPNNQPQPNQPNRPGQPNNQPQPNQPNNRPGQPNQPQPAQPNRPEANRPEPNQPNNRPGQPNNQPNRPEANQPQPNQPNRPGQPNNRPEPNQPNNRPGQPNQPQPNQPNHPEANRPEPNQPNRPGEPNNRPEPNQPANRPNQPENRPPAAQPNRPEPNQPNRPNQPENRPPAAQPNNRPNQPENRPPAAQPNRPEPNQPNRPNQPENRPPAAQPNRPAQPENRPPAAQPNRPEPNRNEPPARQQAPPQAERPQQRTPPPEANKPAPPPQRQQQKPQTPEEKKRQDKEKPPGA